MSGAHLLARAGRGLLGWSWLQAQRFRAKPAEPPCAHPLEGPFMEGANLPWFSYGCDFGRSVWHPAGGLSTPQAADRARAAFEALRRSGIRVLRWFLFADGRSGILADPAGRPTGLDEQVFPDLDLALDLAGQYCLRLIPVCFDYLLCGPERWVRGVRLGGRSGWLTVPGIWRAVEDAVLAPLFSRYGNHPALLAWDLFNEPEWAASGLGWKAAGVPPWILRERLGRMALLAHRCGNRPITVGLCTTAGLPLVRGIGLDFFQVHWYDRYDASSPLDRPVDRLGLDRPLLLGEFPTRNTSLSRERILELARRNGYCGALAWSLLAEDDFSGMG